MDSSTWTRAETRGPGPGAHHDVLPHGYDRAAAEEDRRHLAQLRDRTVPWRTKRRLRHTVGDENELAARLTAWEAVAPPPPASQADAVRLLPTESVRLAQEYHDVCAELYGAHDPDVVANARRIAAGAVAPATAREAIAAERDRLASRSR